MDVNGTTPVGGATDNSDNALLLRLTVAAFAISIAAIGLSTLQALLAYLQFDNSEVGRRRCSKQIMGPLWSKCTERKFLWQEFRYQVFFQVPVLYTAPPWVFVGPISKIKPEPSFSDRFWPSSKTKSNAKDGKPIKKDKPAKKDIIPMETIEIDPYLEPIYKVTGTKNSFESTMTEYVGENEQEQWASVHTAEDEGCSWILLLDALQGQERTSRKWDDTLGINSTTQGWNHTICYLMQKKRRCWDFMPLNVTKPFATTTLCHVVEMMSMLGLVWKEFDMEKTVLSAEGNGYMSKSEYVQGLGILIKFSLIGPRKPVHEGNRIIPCVEIKRLCFGEVPSIFDKQKHQQKLQVGPDQLKNCLEHLLPNLDSVHQNLFLEKCERPLMLPSAFELIAMVAKSVHIPGSKFRSIPNPCADAWTPTLDIFACLKAFSREFSGLVDNSPSLGSDPLVAEIKGLFHDGRNVLSYQQGLTYKFKTYTDASADLENEEKQKLYSPDPDTQIENATRSKNKAYLDLLDSLHKAIEKVDERLEALISEIRQVLASHFSVMFDQRTPLKEALARKNGSKSKEEVLMNYYFHKVRPGAVRAETVRSSGDVVRDSTDSTTATDDSSTGDANLSQEDKSSAVWLALMFRMWSWLFLHDFNPLDKMIERTEFLGSRLPVFIG